MSLLKKDSFTFRDEQKLAISFLVNRNAGLISYGTGKGKTLIQIAAALYLIHKSDKYKADKFIINATKSSIIEIEDQMKEYTNVPYVIIETIEDLFNFMTGGVVVGITRYEYIKNMMSKVHKKKIVIDHEKASAVRAILSMKKVGFCFDEFHKLMNPSSKLTETYRHLRQCMSHCYGFTATPIMKNLTDLFNLILFLDPNFYSGNIHKFLRKFTNRRKKRIYTKNGSRDIMEVISFKNLDVLKDELSNYVLSDYSTSQSLNFVKETLEISDKETYMNICRGLSDVNGDKIDIKNSSSIMANLQSFVNSDVNKRQKFLSVVKKHIESGVIVYCSYLNSVDLVTDILEDNKIFYYVISGSTSLSDRKKIKDDFKEDPVNKVLIVTRAGGQSLNLHSTNKIIFYDIEQNIGRFVQVIGRVVRQFSSFEDVYIMFIIASGTIDEYKYEYLEIHKEIVLKLLDNTTLPDNYAKPFNSFLLSKLKGSLLWKYGD